MTVSSTNRKAGPFLGDDVAIRFPFVFKVFSKEDVRAVHADVLGVESDLILDRGFSVTLNSDQENTPGGEVVLSSALPSGETVTLTSKVQALQKVKITNAGGFYPSVQNTVFDKLTVLVQQLAEQVSRAVKVKISSDTNPDELVADLQHKATLAVQAQTRAEEAAQIAQSNAELVILNTQATLAAKEEAVQLREKAQESQIGASGFALRAEAAQGQARFYKEQSLQVQGRVERDATRVAEAANSMTQATEQAAQFENAARDAISRVQEMVHEAKQLSTPADASVTTDKLAPDLELSGSPTAPTPIDPIDNSTKIATTAFTQNAILAAFTELGRQSMGENGYQKLPGGVILQWGCGRANDQGYTKIFFPVEFSTACLGVLGIHVGENPITVISSYLGRAHFGRGLAAVGAQLGARLIHEQGPRRESGLWAFRPDGNHAPRCFIEWLAIGY